MYSNTIVNPATVHPVSPMASGAAVSSPPATVLKPLTGHNHWMLHKYIQAITGVTLSEDEKQLINAHLKVKKLRKRQFFLQEGDACRYIGFIVKGATKMYTINERGQESIISFCMENDWLTDLESFIEGCESNYHIEALEDIEMIMLDRNQLFHLLQQVPALNLMFRQFQVKQLIESQKRINASLSMTAEERYQHLLTCRPEYAQRFSQNMLACYLGVKPETLSRIRKR